MTWDTILFYRRKDYSERPGGKNYKYYGWGWEILFTFFMAVTVYQIMIPISLYISMELVHIGQAYFMTNDDQMYDESSDSSFQCRALNINEDLGQIKCLFSDKTGLVEEGRRFFKLMRTKYGLSPNVVHYSCIVDILGRAGLLSEAYELINSIPFDPTASIWGSLLASCRVYKNLELAEVTAKKLFGLEPENAGNHVLLSNVQTNSGMK